jgi:DNA-binding transcriptional LysR family regulator
MKPPENNRKEGKSASAHDRANRLPHGHISLKEWNTLLAVVRNDGFARAAEVLHISQPAISYTVAKIEERLGIAILRQEGRRARVTPLGEQLLQHVEPLVQQAAQVEAIARQLRANWRPEIRLAVVDEFPTRLLLAAIRSFSGSQSDNQSGGGLILTEGTMDAVQQLLHKRKCDLAITRQLGPEMQGDILLEIEHLPVAHPGHALFKVGRPLSEADLHHVLEISIDPAPAATNQRASTQRWHVSCAQTAETALAEGIGYGWLPHHYVQAALAAGRLALLPVAGYPRRTSRFYLAALASRPLSEEARRFVSTLHANIGAAANPGAPPDGLSQAATEP